MLKKFKLGIIGAGFMATAILRGILNAEILTKSEITVSDLSSEALEKIKITGVETTTDNQSLAENSEYILFAVKPQNLGDVLNSLDKDGAYKIISILAGTKKEKFRRVLGNATVARAMPNTPCSIESGAIALDCGEYGEKDKEFIVSLFSVLGQVVLLDESKINAVTGVSGSSPAYFYLFAQGIIEAGIQNGLTYEDARLLAVNTMIGSGKMILANPGKKIDELIGAVCSKGGTTVEAVDVYKKEGLSEITLKAVSACIKRAEELEKL